MRFTAAAMLAVSAAATLAAVSPQASRYYEDALARYEKKDRKGAIIQLKNALQGAGDFLPAHLLLGKALLEDGQPAAAEAALSEALRLGAARAEIVLPLATSLVDQGRSALVLSDPRLIPQGLPAEREYRLQLIKSSAAADVGQMREAMALLEAAKKVLPNDPDAWLAEATLHLRGREFARADTALGRAEALTPGSSGAAYLRAQVSHVRGDLKAALAGYDRTLAQAPDHVDALLARAGVLIDQGRYDDARRDVTALRKLAEVDPRGAYLAALLAEKAGDPEAAKTALREVTSFIDPIPIEFLRYRAQTLMVAGLAHYGLGEKEAARPFLEAYKNLDPRSPVSKLLARILLSEGKTELAMQALDEYLRSNPADAQAQALMAGAMMASGHAGRATAIAKSGLQTQDSPALRTALGLSLLGSGQAADAIKELEAAWKKDPSQVAAATALVGLYIQHGERQKGVDLAAKLAGRYPQNAQMQVVLAQARLGERDAAGARVALTRALALDPAHRQAQLQLSRLDAREGKIDAAASRLNAMLAKNDRDAEVLFELAVLKQLQRKPADAQRLLELAVLHGPPADMRPSLALSDLHARAGRPGEALAVVKAMAVKLPSDPKAQIALARVQLATQDRDGARASLGAAAKLAEFDQGLNLEIGLLQVAAGNLDAAAYSLGKSLNGAPDFLPALAALAEVEIRTGRLTDAEAIARRIQQRHPRHALGHTLLGDVSWAKGQRPAAIEYYRQAHKAEPAAGTVAKLAAAYEAEGKAAAAVELLSAWIRANPRDASAKRMLAGAQRRNGDVAGARKTLEPLASAPDADGPLLNEYANLVALLDPKAALPIAERALAAAPGDPFVIDTVGWVAFLNGQSDRALLMLRDARVRKPDHPTIRYHLAAVLARNGKVAEAITELDAALASAPRFEGDAAARDLLKSLRRP